MLFILCWLIFLYILDYITKVAFQRGADTVPNIAVVTDDTVFIVAVYSLKFYLGTLG